MKQYPLFPYRSHGDLEALVGPDTQAVMPLLLLLSREHLSDEEKARARALARQIGDWPALVYAALLMRGLPFVEKHVRTLDLLPPEQGALAAQMSGMLKQSTLTWLKVARGQALFVDTCLAPLGVPHVFVKGLTLSGYYDNPGLRQSRDIDVLIKPEALDTVVAKARACGYRMMLNPHDGLFVESDADLDAVLHLKDDIPLLSPDGVLVEVHRSLHEDLPDTSIDALIAEARDTEIAKRMYKVLPMGPMVPYLCAHHTRHLWDTSNYVADIAAIRRHPAWDAAEVDGWARRFGLEHVVSAALEFEAATRSGDVPKDSIPAYYSTLFALHVEGTEAADSGLERAFKAVNRWIHRIDAPLMEYWTVFRRQFRPTMQDYVTLRVPVHRRLFYRLLGIAKIVGKSRRRLMGQR